MKIALGIEYDGHLFHGWQRQLDRSPNETRDDAYTRTVQDVLETAISRVANHQVKGICAGRTDALVHATGQVIHFESDSRRSKDNWIKGINTFLPTDISVHWVSFVDDDFHARFSAISRSYRYIIHNNPTRKALLHHYATWEREPLDVEAMKEAAKHLIGKHDFTSFRASACQAKTAIRNVQILTIKREKESIIIDIKANAFLHHMVRNIAGVLMTIGANKKEPIWAKEVLKARDRTLGGVTAKPNGLYLIAVEYPDRYQLAMGL